MPREGVERRTPQLRVGATLHEGEKLPEECRGCADGRPTARRAEEEVEALRGSAAERCQRRVPVYRRSVGE